MRRALVLLHPAFTGAVAVLAVNDHVLKDRYPGWWTGKLSDLAGVFVAGVVLGVLARPRLGAVLAVCGFTALKLSPWVAAIAAPVLGGTTRRDPTDLMALVMVVPAYRLARRARPEPERPLLQTALLVMSAGAMTMTVTATSCFEESLSSLVVQDGVIFAMVHHGPGTGWASSSDGGRTWARTTTAPTASPQTSDVVCAGDHCFRISLGDNVSEAIGGGPWRVAYRFSDDDLEAMNRRADCSESTRGLFSLIAVVDVEDEPHVVVGMGSLGVLHRTPDGEWERRAVLDLEPISTAGPSWLWTVQFAPLALGTLSWIPAVVAGRHHQRRHEIFAFAIAGTGAVVLLALVGLLLFLGVDYAVSGAVLATLSVAVFVASVVFALRTPRPPAARSPYPWWNHPPPPPPPPPRAY